MKRNLLTTSLSLALSAVLLAGCGAKAPAEQAGKSGARKCLIIGPDEAAARSVVIKDLENGRQESVPQAAALHHLQTGTDSND